LSCVEHYCEIGLDAGLSYSPIVGQYLA
jgi:hypothetical protein